MQIRCRNCGAIQNIPKYHGPLRVTCSDCEWQELLPARRALPKELDHGAGSAFIARAERYTVVRERLVQISSFSRRRFDQFCACMFAAEGYDVAFADQMLDESHAIELRSGDEKVFVACKVGGHPIPVDDLELLAGSMRHGGAARAICVTPGAFDDACRAFAAEAGLHLIDEHALLEQLTPVPPDQLDAWMETAEVTSTE